MGLKNVEDVYGLGPMQQGILFHMLYAPQSEVYFSQFVCTIEQPLDVSAFRLAWQQMLARHSVLRSAFLWEGLDQPLQLVRRQVELSWEQLEWRGLPLAEQKVHLETFLAADRARGFDLAAAPLLRLFLIQTAEQTYTFVSSSPHLLLDGWSRVLLLQEVSVCYRANLRGQNPRLPQVRPYRDYIGWLQRQDLSRAESYWRGVLQGFTTPTTLGKPRMPAQAAEDEQQTRYASRKLCLSAEATAALQRLTRQQQVTLNTLLQGAWAMLLSRYSGERDIIFGVTVAGRPASLPGSESIVGLFINTLPLRVAVQPDAPLNSWLKYLQEQQSMLLEYQHAPLVQIQTWSEIPRGQPLFESILVFENTLSAVSWEQTDELEFRDIRGGVEQTNYPLTLVVGPDSELVLLLSYDTALFESEMIAVLLQHLRNLLEHMAATPAAYVRDLSLLSTDEQKLLLDEWNRTRRAYPSELCVHELFEEQVRRTPEAVALVFAEQTLTYQELNARANRLARRLRQLGVAPETRIAICMERSPELLMGLLAILKAGGAYVPLDRDYPVERLAFMLQDAQIPLLITQGHLRDLFPIADAQVICLDDVDVQLRQHSPANLVSNTGAHNLAYIMYTSGSTGWPKGVEISHQNIVRLLYGGDYARLDSAQTLLQMAPAAFDAATFEIWGALLHGGRCVLYPEKVPTSRSIEAIINTQGVNTLWLTASLFNMVIEEEPEALRGIQQLLIGGEALSVPHVRHALEQLPETRIINGYGPTESTTFTCCFPIVAPLADDARSIPLGRPIGNTQVYVLDPQLRPVPVGIAGELYIGGAGLARGYLNHPELTAERFVPHPFSGQAGARLYRTGDLVRYLPDGTLDFLGRFDQQIKLRGFRIELGEIEAVLTSHPEVREAAVLVLGETSIDKQLVAYIVPRPGQMLSLEDMRDFLQSQLPGYMVPTQFVPLEQLPLNPNGKLDRRALPAPGPVNPTVHAGAVAAHNPVEEVLAEQWAALLGVEQVGIHDNFFELGGHSLLATQAVSRLYKTFGIELPLRNFFEAPTIEATARHVMGVVAGEVQIPALTQRPRPERLPLSFAQQRLWFLHQLEPGDTLYNIRAALSFEGPLSVAAFAQSLQTIVQRHEVLRTTLSAVDGFPQQHIAATLNLALPLVDLQALPVGAQQATIQHLALQEARRPFDLEHGPLLRVTLLRLRTQEHVLLLTMQHIVSDEWSLEIFGRELNQLYSAYRQGMPAPLAPLSVQYADFALWQREWLQGSVLQGHLDYWRAHLRDAPPTLELPTDRPRPARQTFRGGISSFELSQELSRALKALSVHEGVTLFMTLLAAFKILLARYSGQEDIVVGSPIANRGHMEIEELIGFFVNTLVLRTDLTGNPTFQDLLRRVREVALEAYAHQDLPFEKLVEELSPERDLSRHPLFQVMFVIQHLSTATFALPELTPKAVPVESGTTKFDLTLSLLTSAQGIYGQLAYNTDLFDAATIERMVTHFQVLLKEIVAAPRRRIFELPLLTEAEKRQMLRERNPLLADVHQEKCLHELIEVQVDRTPDVVAVVFGEEQLTYHELNRRANQLAHLLRKQGVGPDVLVGVHLYQSIEMLIAIPGILKAGGAYVPLDPTYPGERIDFLLQDIAAPVLITQKALREQEVGFTGVVVCLDDGEQKKMLSAESQENPANSAGPQHLAYVIYTSGSTGRPKGVMVTQSNLVHSTLARVAFYKQHVVRRFLLLSSFAFDSSVAGIFWTLSQGGALVLPQDAGVRDIGYLAALVEHQAISHVLCIPALYALLLERLPTRDFKHLRAAIVAGEVCPITVFEQHAKLLPSTAFVNEYGPTEGTVWSSAYMREEQETLTRVPIGQPIANVEAYLLDQYQQPVPVGVPGELFIGGPGLARGYLNHPDLTAERFVSHPFSSMPGARLYRTGDLVRALPAGNLEFLRRVDQQVKIRGYRIELGEVEAALTRHGAVAEAAALAREDTPGGARLVAYLVLSPGSLTAVIIDELRMHLRASLPEYMVPTAFVRLDALPLTPNGKLNRRALPAPMVDNAEEASTAIVSALKPTEELLSGLWSELLGTKHIGLHDNFFALGGHSLLAIQLISRIRTLLQKEIPVRTLFEAPTVAGLAEQIERVQRDMQGLSAFPLASVSRDQDLPLSFAQRRLWFLEQLQPENTAYNVPQALRLKGGLNVQALAQSIQQMVQRHEVLRTTFALKADQPVQIIEPTANVRLPLVDSSGLSVERCETEARWLAQQEALRPFDLTRGPLLRVTLLRLSRDEHVLLLSMHHIVSDEWSLEVLLRELNALYRAFALGEPSSLAALPLQYADFALWQRHMLQDGGLQNQLDYWREQLHGMPSALNLPIDYPRPALQTFRGASTDLRLSQALSDGLKALSVREGVTLFMTLLAAFQVLLARYSGQQDIVVGSPIANRTRLELEGLIGCFVNTLILRTDLAGNPSFEEVLRRVREAALGAYTHQDFPFDRLVELLQPERDLSRNPLFQVQFVLAQATRSTSRLADLAIDEVPLEVEKTKFDLTLTLIEGAEGIRGSFTYNCDLFEARTIEQMARHLQVLLAAIVASPQQRLFALPLLTQPEQQLLLADWNATRVAYPRDVCLHTLVETRVERCPDRVAVAFEDLQLTYRDLNARANGLAHDLRAAGCGPESRVAVCLERSPELVVSMLAVLKAGGAYVPLEPTYPSERLRWMLQNSQVTALITQRPWLTLLAPLPAAVFCVDPDYWTTLDDKSRDNPCSGVRAQNQAYVIYTSGSTGQPKGVINTHQGICNRLLWMQDSYALEADDRVLQKTPFSFDVSVWEFFWPLLSGSRLVVARPEGHRDSAYLLRLIQEEQISTLHFVPSMLSAFLEESGLERCHSLRRVICSGEALSYAVQQRFFACCSAALYNLYGPTEAAVDVTSWHCLRGSVRQTVPIGRPIANLEIYLLDAYLQPVPIGVAGEMYIGGTGLARGYLNRPDLTAERFIAHPWSSEPGARLYHTGDQARWLSDGTIEFLGRSDTQVKIRGFRIEPGEIEIALAEQPQVREVAVVAREDLPGGRSLVAYIVPSTAEVFSPQSLRAHLQERLPEYMIPTAFVEMQALPTTANGKLDRQRLPLPDLLGALDLRSAEPTTGPEKILARIWTEVLGIERIGIHANFFAIGGDSILSLLIIARARKAGLLLTPRQMFQYQTIAGLAAVATAVAADAATALEDEDEQGPVPLLPTQRWFFEQRLPEPWHWNQAMCLELPPGRIESSLLQQALAFLVERHAALRLRFVHNAQGWEQSIAPTEAQAASLLRTLDLSVLPVDAQTAAFLDAATRLQADLHLEVGPLLRALYVKRGAFQPDLLLVAIHHLAIDTVSWRILLEDLRTIYSQFEQARAVQLPAKTSSFKRWSESLHAYADASELLKEADYWLAPERQDVLRLPLDFAIAQEREANTEATLERISLSLEAEETRALLQDVPGVYHTQINEILLTALVLACAPWLGRRKLLVDLEGHGREALFDTVDTSRTVGWFTSIFPLLLDLEYLVPSLHAHVDLGEALKTIKEQVRAVPRHGIGYGVLRYLSRESAIGDRLARLPQAQISFNYLGQFGSAHAEDGQDQAMFRPSQVGVGQLRSPQGTHPHLLDISALIAEGRFQVTWLFSTRLYRRETIDTLAQRYLEMLRALIAHCRAQGAGGYTPSDFPELGLSQNRLDKIMGKLRAPKQ